MGTLDGKVVIITGGGNGIGRSTAYVCAREGAKVAIADVDTDGGELTAKMIEDGGGEAIFVQTDVTDRQQVEKLVELTVERFGGVDGAFNNAGIEGEGAPIDECTEQNWQRVLDVNLSSAFRCMQVELEVLKQGHGGSIVNCASVAGLVGFRSIPAYVASKHALVGLTKAAALDLAQQGVRVNAVCPGVIDTDMITRFTHGDPEVSKAFESMEPVGRMGTPEEIGELVAWLLSDRSSFVTGQAIAADGGFVAQ